MMRNIVVSAPIVGLTLLLADCDRAEVDAVARPPDGRLARAATAAPAPSPAPTSAWVEDTELTCTWPVKADDTVDTLRQRFAGRVAVQDVAGPEGTTLPGAVLWPDDRERRIEVAFTSDARERVDFVRVDTPSDWSLLGLHYGDGLASVRAINGGPFEFSGFGWDAGGNVSHFRGGHFGRLAGCRALMVLAWDYEGSPPPMSLVGDVPLMSDNPQLDPRRVHVDMIGLAFDPEN